MADRGYLVPGMRADITVFDPATINDRATYAEPTLVSTGVRHVFVNGRLALRDGQATGVQGGTILLRTAHMPSRPMIKASRRRSASGSGVVSNALGSYTLRFAAKQAPGSRFATGKLTLRDIGTGVTWTVDHFGTIQVTDGWTSLTAVLRDSGGHLRPATLTVDRGAKTGKTGSGSMLILSLVGHPVFTGPANRTGRFATR